MLIENSLRRECVLDYCQDQWITQIVCTEIWFGFWYFDEIHYKSWYFINLENDPLAISPFFAPALRTTALDQFFYDLFCSIFSEPKCFHKKWSEESEKYHQLKSAITSANGTAVDKPVMAITYTYPHLSIAKDK